MPFLCKPQIDLARKKLSLFIVNLLGDTCYFKFFYINSFNFCKTFFRQQPLSSCSGGESAGGCQRWTVNLHSWAPDSTLNPYTMLPLWNISLKWNSGTSKISSHVYRCINSCLASNLKWFRIIIQVQGQRRLGRASIFSVLMFPFIGKRSSNKQYNIQNLLVGQF